MEKIYKVSGMTCNHCKEKIEEAFRKQKGIEDIQVNLKKKTLYIRYDEKRITPVKIRYIVESLDYGLEPWGEEKKEEQTSGNYGFLYMGVAILVFLMISRIMPDFSTLLTAGSKIGLLMLFIIGITTSFHCISMCGGIALSQVISEKDNMKRNLLYNTGRVISYTLLGGIVGFLGKGITLGNRLYGVIPILLGILMVMMGLSHAGMLSLGQWKITQKFNRHLMKFKNKLSSNQGPFMLGILNGFMPCGPLQLMQIYALSTGSFLEGAAAMFAFSLGTVPLMLGMGVLVHKLSIKARVMVYKMGGYLILLLGMSMIMNGTSTLGIGSMGNFQKGTSLSGSIEGKSKRRIEDGYQVVEINVGRRNYEDIVVEKDIPVKMILNVPTGVLNGCNYAINIPAYDIFTTLEEGENVIIFEPTEAGKFMYSCWMGMIRNTITVVDGDIEAYEATKEASAVTKIHY